MKKFGPELDHKLKKLVAEKNCFMEKSYSRIGTNTDDDLPLNKPQKFATLTIITRCVFQEAEKLYPHIY